MMSTGLLWMDNDPTSDLLEQIARAARYYQLKYGCKPNLCFVHPSLLKKALPDLKEVEVRINKRLLPYQLWVGITDCPGAGQKYSK